MILDRVKLIADKDPIVHVVTDTYVDLWTNQKSGVESIEMHVSLTSSTGVQCC